MKTIIDFHRHMFAMPKPVLGWVMVLFTVNFLGGVYFFETLEGRVVAGTIMVAAMALIAIYAVAGFSRLMGLGHFVWFPMLAWLWLRLEALPDEGGLQMWVIAVMVVNAISLVMDVIDVARWLRGARDPVVVLD